MRTPSPTPAFLAVACALAVATLLPLPAAAGEPSVPLFSKQFVPPQIGLGSSTTLSFSITNVQGVPAADLAFTDTLPAGVVIADPSQASTDCVDGTLTAPPGGDTITFTGGTLGPDVTCTVSVDVTSDAYGDHLNVSGDLTSSLGNSGPAQATLTVDTERPGFSKEFSPASVPLGGRSTLTFTIDNSGTEVGAFNLQFSDKLPTGLVVADPANLSTTCGGTPTAAPGSDLVTLPFSGASVSGGSSCIVSVDVTATGVGALGNTSGELLSQSPVGSQRSSGRASATLDVTADALHLVKSFVDDPTAPGGTATLRFTVLNFDRELTVTDITFTDDLDATLSGLTAVAPLPTDPCGAGSTLTGTSLLTFSNGVLPPEGSCTFDVTLQVPAGAATGGYANTTSAITGDLDGSPVLGGPATETLFVAPVPVLTKEFTDDPVGAGGTVHLEFTITNQSTTDAATDIAFTDMLAAVVASASNLPPSGFCGAGSTLSFLPGTESDPPRITVSGGQLAASDSCTFSVDLGIAAGSPGGLYPNTTSPITATVAGEELTGSSASDVLQVAIGPVLMKTFTDDPVDPGSTATLELTLSLDENATGDATAVSFTDDLDAALSGLTALGLPMTDVCGMGSMIDGTDLLTFTGGTLMPGESCTFQVTLSVPSDAAPGPHTNTTSAVTATVSGVATIGRTASDDLSITGLATSKEFTDDPAVPGGSVTLSFRIDNLSSLYDATGIAFSDDLADVLSGLTATGLPMMDVCGMGSSLVGLSGNTAIALSGGSVPAGGFCSFSVTLQVPVGAATGTYPNTTSSVSATMAGTGILFPPAVDELEVSSDLLFAAKSFTDDPAAPGGTVTLEFTLTNTHGTQAITDIAFTDDLDAVVPGLSALGLPATNVCGAGSTLSGTSVITLTGADLAALDSCTFSATLSVPAAVPLGSSFPNTTSTVTGMLGGLAVTGQPATDDLVIDSIQFDKAFSGPTVAGGTVVLTFTLENLDGTDGVGQLGFTDDLSAVLPGLVAVGLPMTDVCGTGSSLSGTSLLTLTGGSLSPSGVCSFPVTLQVPAGATPGTYPNVTSDVFSGGLSVGSPATDALGVEPPPTFAKQFSPSAVPAGDPSTLTFTVDNSASALAASALDFTDNLPAGLVVASPAGASTTCSGGTITAAPGSGVVSYTGGSVAAGAVCSVQADVTGTTAGDYVNVSGDLTSSSGNSGTATDTLTILDIVPPEVTNVDSILGTDGSIDECDSVRTAVAALLVTFDEAMYAPGDPMDPNAITNPDNWMLVGSGADHDLSTTQCGPLAGDDVATTFSAISWNPGSLTATLVASGPGPVADAPYRLMACSGGLVDDGGANPLDGDGDGTGGDDFVRTFRIDRYDALDNGHFDCGLDAWTVDAPPSTMVEFSSDDVDGADISGSAVFTADLPAISGVLGQCAPILPESIYRLSGFVRLDSSQPRRFLTACDTFASMDCSGSPLFSTRAEVLLGAPGVWTPFSAETDLMPGVHSSLCRASVLEGNEAPYSVHLDDVSFDAVFTQVIFQDGFESGDTSAWTTTVP